MITKKLLVSYGYAIQKPGDLGYRVERVTNSIEFNPGDLLSRSQVEELCEHRSWTVEIIAMPARKK